MSNNKDLLTYLISEAVFVRVARLSQRFNVERKPVFCRRD